MMLDYEEKLYKLGYKVILGADEAGRGPLCGPLVVAAVILKQGYQNDLINDSKQLSEKIREELFPEIINNSLAYHIEIIEPEIIDKLNIYQASRYGMEKCVEAILNQGINIDCILTDAMKLQMDNFIPVEALIKGDCKSLNIASASILAKVTRDRIMAKLDALAPEYQFAKHKGYPTKLHLDIISNIGIIQSIYRFSYKPVQKAKINQKYSSFPPIKY